MKPKATPGLPPGPSCPAGALLPRGGSVSGRFFASSLWSIYIHVGARSPKCNLSFHQLPYDAFMWVLSTPQCHREWTHSFVLVPTGPWHPGALTSCCGSLFLLLGSSLCYELCPAASPSGCLGCVPPHVVYTARGAAGAQMSGWIDVSVMGLPGSCRWCVPGCTLCSGEPVSTDLGLGSGPAHGPARLLWPLLLAPMKSGLFPDVSEPWPFSPL